MKPLIKTREIKGARTRLGYTQQYVADQLGITVLSYRNKEGGRVRFTDNEMIGLAEVLQLSLVQFNDFLFDGKLPAGTIAAVNQ